MTHAPTPIAPTAGWCTSLAMILVACTPVTGMPSRDASVADAATDAATDVTAGDVGPAAPDVSVDDVSGCPRGTGSAGVSTPVPFANPDAAAFAHFSATGVRRDDRGRLWFFGRSIGCRRPDAATEPTVLRLLPDGTLDEGFGVGGRVCVSSPQSTAGSNGRIRDVAFHGGRAVLVGAEVASNGTYATGIVALLTDDGRLDPTFAQGGIITFPDGVVPWEFPSRFLSAVAVDDEGITVAGTDYDQFWVGTYGVLSRLTWAGRRDVAFGDAGRVIVTDVQSFAVILPTAWGLLAIGSSRRAAPYLLALDRRGARVPWFGDGGVAQRALSRGLIVNGAIADSRGGYVIAGSSGGAARLETLVAAAVRFDGAGRFDESFGAGGVFVSPWLRHPSYLLAPTLARQCDGRLLLAATDRGVVGKVHRLTPDGHPDGTFGVEGTVTVDVLPTWFSPSALFESPLDGVITLLGGNGSMMPMRFALSP